ncbi:n-acetylmuramoyl-L-alanine amidase, partial [Nephila pilipes]
WVDIGYHFVIGGDGLVYEGRPWYKMGAHTKYHNRKSIGIAFLGDYDKDCPNPSMLDIIPKLVYCGVEKGYISPSFKVIAHKDAYCTSCPGTALYDVIKKWPHYPKVPIHSYTCDAKTEAPTMPPTTIPPTTTEMPTTTTTTTTVAPTTTPEPTTTTTTT